MGTKSENTMACTVGLPSRVLLSKALPRMIPAMSQTTFFALAWLLIGIAWAYRSVTRKEYAGLLIALGFALLAVFSFLRK
ncbi:MAG: hypothetical protein WB621_15910 [Candidatus Acidiferrales bacterium]